MIKLIVMITVALFIGYCNCHCERKEDELLSVVGIRNSAVPSAIHLNILFRHGDKTPKLEYFDVYPNNPWNIPKLWNHSDYGFVTTAGKLNVYNRGKWLRERYKQFLPEKYSAKNIFVQSSDSDRVLASAQLLLAGLFPPKGTDVWNDNLMWQPIPIHSVPDYNDTEVAQKVTCSKYTKLLDKQLKSDVHEFEDTKYLSQYIGKELTSLEQIYKLYKLLRIVEENGMVLPGWALNAMPLLKTKTDLLCKTYSLTLEMQRFMGGPIIHAMSSHFDAVLAKSPNAPKLLLFAGHSRTISNVLMALNAFIEQPPYTATLLFELKKNCNGTPFVDIYYQTNKTGDPAEIVKNMPYKTFQDHLNPISVDHSTWRKECRTGFIFRE
ncbi:lysosomal acid phosphatase-like [Anoplophora glabripennis]|uniref:lysosomal acid phosphatase-like n=1 Tax=Anoplophora glabripennis TaxID=217634 RepID=UPI0008748712|nr:lysosomal acid phosphatase-like [Anoplophora glabripennis]